MNIRNPTRALAVLLFVSTADAATEQDFNTSYKAYRDAAAAQRVDKAAEHAAETRRLGEELYADDPQRMAILAFNHGIAFARAKRGEEALRVLKEARELVAQAFGEDAEQLMQIDVAVLDVVPRARAGFYMRKAIDRALERHPENSDYIADLKLRGGMRMWNRDTVRTLAQAAEIYQATGNRRSYGMAHFWIGRKHFGAKDYREAAAAFTRVVETLPADEQLVLMARANLVQTFENLGESDRATEHCLAIGRTTPWTGEANYQPLFKAPPEYPQEALRKNIEGTVLLTATVDDMGFVRNPQIVESTAGEIFDDSALEAVRKFRYAPKFTDGKPVAVTGVLNLLIFEMVDAPPGSP